jgi:hypothetical protein
VSAKYRNGSQRNNYWTVDRPMHGNQGKKGAELFLLQLSFCWGAGGCSSGHKSR